MVGSVLYSQLSNKLGCGSAQLRVLCVCRTAGGFGADQARQFCAGYIEQTRIVPEANQELDQAASSEDMPRPG